jgi:hypothetical protein
MSVGPAAPVSVVAPTISGSAVSGSVLSVSSNGTWSGYPSPTFAYQWQNAGVDIDGETGSTYTTVAGDVGDAITVVVTATNSEGSASASSNAITVTAAPVAPENTVAPALSGTATVSNTLTSSTGTWTGTGKLQQKSPSGTWLDVNNTAKTANQGLTLVEFEGGGEFRFDFTRSSGTITCTALAPSGVLDWSNAIRLEGLSPVGLALLETSKPLSLE